MRRRSGISTLIGTVFFVLVVALVVATFAGLFDTFGSFVQQNHAASQRTLVEKESAVGVPEAAFGGLLNESAATNVPWTNNTSPNQVEPLRPILNMNFTGGMAGWASSKSYALPEDNASVSNANTTDRVMPNMTNFDLVVKNNDPLTSARGFARVTLLVAQAFTLVSFPSAPSCTVSPGFTSNPVVSNHNITWSTSSTSNGEPPGGICNFYWSANVTATSPGVFFHTVVVTWYSTITGRLVGGGMATVDTDVTTGPDGKLRINGTSSTEISSVPQAYEPSGLTLGYDPSPVDASTLSGAGSAFLQFQPSLNSASLTALQQLSATVDFSTSFQLTSSMAAQVSSSDCCTFTMETDLNRATAAPNPLVFYRVYLENLDTAANVTLNPGGTDPALGNDFGPTGWNLTRIAFNPGASFWTASNYTLTVSTNVTILGTANHTAGYFPVVEMHFDDVGLSLLPPSPSTASFYAMQDFEQNLSVDQNPGSQHEVQQITLGANVTQAPLGSIGYLQALDSTTEPPQWTTLETVFFQNATAAQFLTTIPSSHAGYYVAKSVNGKGLVNDSIDARVILLAYGLHSVVTSYKPEFQVYSITGTVDSSSIVILLDDASPQPVNLTAIYVSGPSPPVNYTLGAYLHHQVWLGESFLYAVQLPLNWEPGQVYTVTLVTSQGVIYSKSFVSP